MKILIDKFVPYAPEALAPYAEVELIDGRTLTPEKAAEADALIVRTRTQCNHSLLHKADHLRFVGTATIGYDHIDRTYCADRGIKVQSAAGCNARGVLQWVSAVLAKLAKEQGWQPKDKTLGVVGVGNVGRLVAEYGALWGFKVVCNDPPRQKAEGLTEKDGFYSLEEVVKRADIITFHTPLVRSGEHPTLHLCNKALLAGLKDGAVVINASRGEVADTAALISNAQRLTLCIDVWEGEPDKLSPELLKVATVATPHIAGYSLQGKANASAIVVRSLAELFDIEMLKMWYPDDINPSCPKAIDWEQMCTTIENHCDLDGETKRTKAHPEKFEQRRNSYPLREEYF